METPKTRCSDFQRFLEIDLEINLKFASEMPGNIKKKRKALLKKREKPVIFLWFPIISCVFLYFPIIYHAGRQEALMIIKGLIIGIYRGSFYLGTRIFLIKIRFQLFPELKSYWIFFKLWILASSRFFQFMLGFRAGGRARSARKRWFCGFWSFHLYL